MNKNELVAYVAENAKLTKKQSEEIVKTVFQGIEDALKKGEKVQLVGFGTFESKHRDARKGLKPGTTEVIDIPECNAPVFKAGKALKDALNK